ncbi:hypothetical protein CPC08DRAFT_226164 [Agrocybe pediades]|nr:hypothetical protein CPC08DRAFT_226164 [Agrocybe pediades]
MTKSLDVCLPSFVSTNSSAAIATSTAHFLALSVQSEAYRRLVTEWVPPAERQRRKDTARTRRALLCLGSFVICVFCWGILRRIAIYRCAFGCWVTVNLSTPFKSSLLYPSISRVTLTFRA